MNFDFGYMEEGKLGKPYNLRLLKRLGKYALPYGKYIALALTVAIIVTLLDLVLPYLSKIAIDEYILNSGYTIESNENVMVNNAGDSSPAAQDTNVKTAGPEDILRMRSKDIKGLAVISGILLSILILSFFMNYGEFYLLEFIGQNIMLDVRNALFKKIQGRSLSYFDKNPVGRLVTRVTNDIENLNEMFKTVLVTFLKDIFLLAGILAVLLYLNWRLALVSFIVLPFVFGFTIIFSSLMREAFRTLREKVSRLNTFQQERVANMWIVQLFAKEKHQMDIFSGFNHEHFLAGMKQLKLYGVFVPLMELISSAGVALIIWYGGGRVISGQLSLGSLVAFISYIQMFFRPIRDLSEKYNIMQLAMASTERIFESMDEVEDIPDPVSPVHLKNIEGHIEFKNVSFSYEPDSPVLKDINFEIRPGEMVAVVGATGAGKSTLVNLIERFYDPDEGAVYLDGVDIRNINANELRSAIGLVMQDVFIFSGNIKNNISLEREGVSINDISNAAEEANAKWFIDKLPGGLSHEMSERGASLSGGERQLLSFARALASRPKILILDEATSSVDPETERLIQEAINKMTKNRTTLVVAHRLSTVRKADRILVMHHGRIKEQGNHEELILKKGIYYKLNLFKEYLHD